jgi:hypothetical protein
MNTLRRESLQYSAESSSSRHFDVKAYSDAARTSPRTILQSTYPVDTSYLLAFTALDNTHRLCAPLMVEVTRESDGFIVSDTLVSRFGEGHALAEALSDYAANVLDYLTTLQERRDRLSPRSARHLKILEELLTEA